MENSALRGRFAPSPSGRMHIGNVYAALMSWLSVRSRGGKWLLRIEDLDPQRSRLEYARQIEDDLHWLGLDWDEGGVEQGCMQSLRHDIYMQYYQSLVQQGLVYPCRCTRADLMVANAPHASDGSRPYAGTCRPAPTPPFTQHAVEGTRAYRLWVPDAEICFTDRVYGLQNINLQRQFGDIVLRRADGAWAYQFAVVVDDALMGVTEVVRGCDLLTSAAPQTYLYDLLGFAAPQFAHLPLLCNQQGQRLSKRDQSLSMQYLRQHYIPAEVIGRVAHLSGLTPEYAPCTAQQLIPLFDWAKIKKSLTLTLPIGEQNSPIAPL